MIPKRGKRPYLLWWKGEMIFLSLHILCEKCWFLTYNQKIIISDGILQFFFNVKATFYKNISLSRAIFHKNETYPCTFYSCFSVLLGYTSPIHKKPVLYFLFSYRNMYVYQFYCIQFILHS